MKRIIQLFSLFTFLPFAADSQITIQADQIEMIGYVAYNSKDEDPDISIVPGGTGLQTWDFSGLQNDEEDTLWFFEASELPFASEFPLANVGVKFGQDLNIFFEQNNERIVSYGSYGSLDFDPLVITATYKYDPPQTSIRFPMQLNNTFNEVTVGTVQVPGSAVGFSVDSVKAISTNHRFVNVDAYGTLTTPAGTYEVLRSTEVEVTYDTVYITSGPFWIPYLQGEPDTTTYYSFWTNQNGLGYPVVQMSVRSNGTVREVGWLNSFISSTKDGAALQRLKVSPNPTPNQLSVELPEGHQGSLEIYDMNGRQVQATKVTAPLEKLDVHRLAVGSYVLVLKNESGQLVGFERFEVAR